MKTTGKHIAAVFIMAMLFVAGGLAQQTTPLQYYTTPGKASLNQFEQPKTNTVDFNGLAVRIGGDFALQFQGLTQSNSGDSLAELANNFTLPTANLNIDVQLAPGMRMHLRTYLSSRHHAEAWVKGGYLRMDQLDFIEEGFLSELMEVLTIRVGMDQYNYGDTHFRRSDNAAAIYNPFVGNYLMDSFSTEPFMEFTIQKNGIIAVLGATNGRLNQRPTPGDDGFAVFGKVGYDSQINEDLRFRLTGSFYNSTDKGTRDYLYAGDRGGGRYYSIDDGRGDFSPRVNPNFPYQTAFQINPFVKFQGLEFFGVFEVASNGADAGGSFTQLGAEALYRLGAEENFYIGGRYNAVSGEFSDVAPTYEVDRINIGGGWFLTDNVLAKLEYVKQTYGGDFTNGGSLQDGEFSGLMIEAVIAF
ncbi:MAG: hypothetical protein JJ971_12775 [Balneolaceae bacterium]|nr:hypothetical protein [Balneolaceae bacterium]MBO6547274.1 hypothetical protein [Balneolaceae bacterium]MBO6647779.1 hypothetical protein [Balneolaceae bacterium]